MHVPAPSSCLHPGRYRQQVGEDALVPELGARATHAVVIARALRNSRSLALDPKSGSTGKLREGCWRESYPVHIPTGWVWG